VGTRGALEAGAVARQACDLGPRQLQLRPGGRELGGELSDAYRCDVVGCLAAWPFDRRVGEVAA